MGVWQKSTTRRRKPSRHPLKPRPAKRLSPHATDGKGNRYELDGTSLRDRRHLRNHLRQGVLIPKMPSLITPSEAYATGFMECWRQNQRKMNPQAGTRPTRRLGLRLPGRLAPEMVSPCSTFQIFTKHHLQACLAHPH